MQDNVILFQRVQSDELNGVGNLKSSSMVRLVVAGYQIPCLPHHYESNHSCRKMCSNWRTS